MRKTTLHVWIAMFFCTVALAADAMMSGSFASLF